MSQHDTQQMFRVAAGGGDVASLERLLLEGIVADVNAPGGRGWTALHRCCCNGEMEALETLIKAKADLECRTAGFCTPFLLAATFGRTQVLQRLKEVGANTKARDDGGRTALDLAVENNMTEAANMLKTWEAAAPAA